MKKRYEEWGKLSATYKPKPRPMIRMIDLPAVRKLEDAVLLGRAQGSWAEEHADTASKELFGNTLADTQFRFPDCYFDDDAGDGLIIETNGRYDKHEAKFATTGKSDADMCAVLKELGLDFTGMDGRPLHCTPLLARQAEAAARRIAGKLPDVEDLSVRQWAANLEEAARAFQQKKRGRER
ncbi:hypothetical protein [Hansschlegelia sp.]|uniref:hypothetical protein n=1 Tax=Hansschlegelia sp. TaxID=2041892 RepID=UPI002C79A000|nr:hypothetical protein [Hansschlegelia sp.]HVI27592.1 hypothetical protein [Hansschlegelia sp.]